MPYRLDLDFYLLQMQMMEKYSLMYLAFCKCPFGPLRPLVFFFNFAPAFMKFFLD